MSYPLSAPPPASAYLYNKAVHVYPLFTPLLVAALFTHTAQNLNRVTNNKLTYTMANVI